MQVSLSFITTLITLLSVVGCGAKPSVEQEKTAQTASETTAMKKIYSPAEIAENNWSIATFGGGCFWCTEAIFEKVEGVQSVVSGYAGGRMADPTYAAVCTDTTGHAECVQIVFDPAVCAYETLLDVHMKTHDPTTVDRQGNDVGNQYRSVVFYSDEAQKLATENYIRTLDGSGYYPNKIVTEVTPLEKFWPAETYHQDYFAKNPDQPYCIYVVAQKVDKFDHLFPELIKSEK